MTAAPLPDAAEKLPARDAETSVRRVPGGVEVTVTARVLLRDVCLFADRIDPAAEVDDMLLTLLPGESTRFLVSRPPPRPGRPDHPTRPPLH